MVNWVKSPGGRWIQDQAPGRPFRAPPPPTQVASPPSGDEALFLRNPITFMRTQSVVPPNDSGTSDFGQIIREIKVTPSDITEGMNVTHGDKLVTQVGGGIRFVKFERIGGRAAMDFPGAKTFSFMPDALTGAMPIHWLPWNSLHIIRTRVPPVPTSLVDPDDTQFPRIFFTAAINGCSVFVQGDAASPTLSHGGFMGKLANTVDFWRTQLVAGNGAPIRGEANTFDYMRGRSAGPGGVKPTDIHAQVEQYLRWLEANSTQRIKLNYLAPFGCVFGVRFGRFWTFYLQRSYVNEEITFYKQNEVEKNGTTGAFHVRQGGAVAAIHPTELDRRKLGGLNLPKALARKVFFTKQTISRPMEVGEIFPRRLISSDLNPQFKLS